MPCGTPRNEGTDGPPPKEHLQTISQLRRAAEPRLNSLNVSWEPLLTGELAERAEQAVNAIAEALRAPPDIRGYSLSTGHAGVALFFGYLSLARSDETWADLASEHLSQAIDSVAADDSPALGLFTGLSGLAWAWQHLNRLLYGETSAEDMEELDEAILEAVRTSPWDFEWDLVYGLAGIGIYALDHPDPSFARETVGHIVARLSDLAIECPPGVAWKTLPEFMTPRNAQEYPDGRFDQGLAHGVPGVIGFLTAAYRRGIAPQSARELLDGSLSWLRANMRPEDGGSRFTYFPPAMVDARAGWCYGDPGVSAVLFSVDQALGLSWCRELAISAADRAARRPFDETGVIDATLCHGAAGLGQIYNRLFQLTGQSDLATAAKTWFERALGLRRPGDGIGGFLNWWPEIREWRPESGFLVGGAGIGLALLASISAVEPLWDSPLLLPNSTGLG